MNFGSLSGLINGTEQVVFKRIVSGSPVTEIDTGNVLNGDEDGAYTIIGRCPGFTSGGMTLQINGDTGTNYGRRGIYVYGTTISNSAAASATAYYVIDGTDVMFFVIRIQARSGFARLINSVGIYADGAAPKVVGRVFPNSGVWANSASNITSIKFLQTSFAVGSEIYILKSNSFSDGTQTGVINTPSVGGSWVRVGSQTLTTTSSSISFPVNGDTDVIYYYSCDVKADAGYSVFSATLNNDTGANYGYGILRASGTSYVATAATASLITSDFQGMSAGRSGHFSGILFGKSGFLHPCISNTISYIDTTTIGEIDVVGNTWSNTGSVTSIQFLGSTNFAIGSQFSLYALRP